MAYDPNLETIEYDGEFEKLQTGGGEEWVDSEVGGWLQAPQKSLWEEVKSIPDAFRAGRDVGIHDATFEGVQVNEWIAKGSDLWDSPEDKINNPIVTPSAAKDVYDLDLENNVTTYQALVLQQLKKNSEERQAALGEHLSWETPIEGLSAFAGVAFGSFAMPTAILSGALVGSAVPFIGTLAGAGVGAGVRAASKWKTISKIAQAAQKSKLSANLLKAKDFSKIGKAGEITAKSLRRLPTPVKRFVKTSAAAGGGNALEEVVIWYKNKANGYDTDLAPAVAMGAFAPAIFMGALQGSLASIKFSAKAKNIIDADTAISTDSFKIGFETTPKQKAQTQAINKMQSLKNIDELTENIKQELAETKDIKLKQELDHLEAIDHLGKSVGRNNLDGYFLKLAKNMIKANTKVSFRELFPFLENIESLKTHIKQLKDQNLLPPKAKLNGSYLEKIMTVKTKDFENYLKNNSVDDLQKPVKRNENAEASEINYTEAVKKRVSEMQVSDDIIENSMGRASRDLESAIDEFAKCVGGIDGE